MCSFSREAGHERMMVCDTGAVAPFNECARRTVATRTPVRLRVSDRLERRLNEPVRHSFSGNKAERELPKKQTCYLLGDLQEDKAKQGDGTGQDEAWRRMKGEREGGRSEASKASQMKFYKPRYLKFSRIGGEDCSFLHARSGRPISS